MSEEKKEILTRMSKKFEELQNQDAKNYAMMCMTAYQSGKEAGVLEERERQLANG